MKAAERGRGAAAARAALAGNPSDGYGGAVLAVTLPAWCARAEAIRAREPEVEPANPLVEATVHRFAREVNSAGSAVLWSTSIPKRVGLGSSSALVIAVIRALCDLHGAVLDPAELAELALAVETEDLGIVAGLQDRVAQAYEGLMFMDFGATHDDVAGGYERLDAELLPSLIVAWREDAAGHSGDVHRALRDRYQRGDTLVGETMSSLAAVAHGARTALLDGDLDRFGRCVDETFELRRRLVPLDPLGLEMIDVARLAGATANYTGSGGAIVAVCRDDRHRLAVGEALGSIGCGVLRVERTPRR